MEGTTGKPGVLKAAALMTLICTICGIVLAIITEAWFLGNMTNFADKLVEDNFFLFTSSMVIGSLGLVLNIIGLISGILLQKNRRPGLVLCRLWAIGVIVLAFTTLVPVLLSFRLSDLRSYPSTSFFDLFGTAYWMNLSAGWQWELGAIVLILLGRPRVKEFLAGTRHLHPDDFSSKESAGIGDETPATVPIIGEAPVIQSSAESQKREAETVKKPGLLRAAVILTINAALIGFFLTLASAISSFEYKAATEAGILIGTAALSVSIAGFCFSVIGIVAATLLSKERKRGVGLCRVWAAAMLALAAFSLFFIIFYFLFTGTFAEETHNSTFAPNLMLFTLIAFGESIPAFLVVAFLGVKRVREYVKTLS